MLLILGLLPCDSKRPRENLAHRRLHDGTERGAQSAPELGQRAGLGAGDRHGGE